MLAIVENVHGRIFIGEADISSEGRPFSPRDEGIKGLYLELGNPFEIVVKREVMKDLVADGDETPVRQECMLLSAGLVDASMPPTRMGFLITRWECADAASPVTTVYWQQRKALDKYKEELINEL